MKLDYKIWWLRDHGILKRDKKLKWNSPETDPYSVYANDGTSKEKTKGLYFEWENWISYEKNLTFTTSIPNTYARIESR